MNLDEIKYSLQNLRQRKIRSFLSVLSIVIGIASIFALLSFGLGIQNYIDSIAEEAGVNKLFIQTRGVGAPGTDANFFLTQDDVEVINRVRGVDETTGLYIDIAKIKFKNEEAFVFINGMDPDKVDFIEESFSTEIVQGRTLKESDSKKAILGYNYQFEDIIFSKNIRTGNDIEINGVKIEVVGFYESFGNPQDDSNIYILYDDFEELFPEKKDRFGFIMASTSKNFEPSEVADDVQDKLRKFKDQEEGNEDFFVQTFEDALQTFNNVVNILNTVLILIALISVVIAIVNITNTMYTAVLERTGEIGVMKSIGARNSNVLSIFIFESGFLGFVGGVFGILLGYIAASIGGQIASNAGFTLLQPVFPLTLILGSLIFATVIGSLAGYFPARQASKLKPVDALRYE